MAKHDLRFTARVTSTNYGHGEEYDHFVAELAIMDGYEVNPVGDYGHPDALRAMDGLRITAQRTHSEDRWYGFEVGMRTRYSETTTLAEAERVVKVLRSVARKMDKLRDQLGYPQDLADFCARVAIAAGATVSSRPFGWYERELTYNGTHYRWLDVDGLRSALAKPDNV